MKQKYFSSAFHTELSLLYIIMYIILFFPLLLGAYRFEEWRLGIIISLGILLYLTIIASKCEKTAGLYIDGDEIYFKRYKKRNINVDDIAGIVKVKANKNDYGEYEKDDNGEILYSAMYVTSITPLMKIFSDGTNKFLQYYAKETMFRTVYDETVINYLKELNPNIVIMPEKVSSEEDEDEL